MSHFYALGVAKMVPGMQGNGVKGATDDDVETALSLRISANLNSASCHIHLKNYEKAVNFCERVRMMWWCDVMQL